MYIPDHTTWTRERTRPLIEGGDWYYYAERCRCGFTTTERLPGSNASMNDTLHEQQAHDSECEARVVAAREHTARRRAVADGFE